MILDTSPTTRSARRVPERRVVGIRTVRGWRTLEQRGALPVWKEMVRRRWGFLAAAERLASRGQTGALVRVHARVRIASESTVRAAWESMVTSLPPAAIAVRTGWADFEAVVEGDEPTLCAMGAMALGGLLHVAGDAPRWAVTLVALRAGRVDRAFVCDPGYDLARLSPCALAWVEPYVGDDWRESQRYPTVRPLDVTSGRAGG